MSEAAQPPLQRLADGTVKQVNPLTGTQVWTVPGRGHRPLVTQTGPHERIDARELGRHCAFCWDRYLDTTPELARLVADGATFHTLTGLSAEQLDDTRAELRLFENLFEIVTLDYWRRNHGYQVPRAVRERLLRYTAAPLGRAHVEKVLRMRGADPTDLAAGEALFGGFHNVVVARRHFVDGARCTDELASSSTLSPAEHRRYLSFTVAAIERLFAANPRIRNVAAFQNWLRPAGASFDHLHKQLVGLDTLGRRAEVELARLREDPQLFRRVGVDLVAEHDLLVASNEHAVAFAGIGHRYPSLEVWLTDSDAPPWELDAAQLAAWADLVHACHAVTGPAVACNEEWHYRPPGVEGRMPLRAVIKWRISTLAGFEGGTDININTLDPWAVRDRARNALAALAGTPALADGITVAH